MAVSLRLAAGGTVAGASEAAVRTLAKLDQVMPARLREEVRALRDSIATPSPVGVLVDGDVLLVLARACRDRVRVTFGYRSADGTSTSRRVEPYRLVAAGARWYLFAHDLDREDWRSFRLDRLEGDPVAGTWRFAPREHPDPASYVQRSVVAAPYHWTARVLVDAPAEEVARRVPARAGAVEERPDGTALVTAGSDDLDALALRLVLLGGEVTVLEPPELREVLAALGERLVAAGRRVPA